MVEITIEKEIDVREFMGDRLQTIPEIGRIVPAPVYFKDKAEYWRTIDLVARPDTRDEIDTEHIFFVMMLWSGFSDVELPVHSPLTSLEYSLYVFSEYDLERADVNATAEQWMRKMLRRHNQFVSVCLQMKALFQGKRVMNVWPTKGSGDPEATVEQFTTSLNQEEPVTQRGECEFIPGVQGHFVTFEEAVHVRFEAC